MVSPRAVRELITLGVRTCGESQARISADRIEVEVFGKGIYQEEKLWVIVGLSIGFGLSGASLG